MGFGPTRYFYQEILSPLRLPVTPLSHNVLVYPPASKESLSVVDRGHSAKASVLWITRVSGVHGGSRLKSKLVRATGLEPA